MVQVPVQPQPKPAAGRCRGCAQPRPSPAAWPAEPHSSWDPYLPPPTISRSTSPFTKKLFLPVHLNTCGDSDQATLSLSQLLGLGPVSPSFRAQSLEPCKERLQPQGRVPAPSCPHQQPSEPFWCLPLMAPSGISPLRPTDHPLPPSLPPPVAIPLAVSCAVVTWWLCSWWTKCGCITLAHPQTSHQHLRVLPAGPGCGAWLIPTLRTSPPFL